jgi:molybdopterin synthase sulfur carrier subunit
MQVHVRLFASLRDAMGRQEVLLDLPGGSSAEDAWGALVASCPALAPRRASVAAAVNREYADFDTPLTDGDEVVFIPPVSGG